MINIRNFMRSPNARLVIGSVSVLIILNLLIVDIPMQLFVSGKSRVPVDAKQIDRMFPVVVVSKEPNGKTNAAIVLENSMFSYLEKVGHNYTYLVPDGEDAVLNQQVQKTPFKYPGHFEVTRLPNGKQLIRVTYLWRGKFNYNSGWYIASDKTIEPLYRASTLNLSDKWFFRIFVLAFPSVIIYLIILGIVNLLRYLAIITFRLLVARR